jgi:hypothetical protein
VNFERDGGRPPQAPIASSVRRTSEPVRLYSLFVPDEVAPARCRERIAGGYVLGEPGFDALRSKFGPLEPDEEHAVVETT